MEPVHPQSTSAGLWFFMPGDQSRSRSQAVCFWGLSSSASCEEATPPSRLVQLWDWPRSLFVWTRRTACRRRPGVGGWNGGLKFIRKRGLNGAPGRNEGRGLRTPESQQNISWAVWWSFHFNEWGFLDGFLCNLKSTLKGWLIQGNLLVLIKHDQIKQFMCKIPRFTQGTPRRRWVTFYNVVWDSSRVQMLLYTVPQNPTTAIGML